MPLPCHCGTFLSDSGPGSRNRLSQQEEVETTLHQSLSEARMLPLALLRPYLCHELYEPINGCETHEAEPPCPYHFSQSHHRFADSQLPGIGMSPSKIMSHPANPQLMPDKGVSNTYCCILFFYVCYRWWGLLLLKGYMHTQNTHINIFISFTHNS